MIYVLKQSKVYIIQSLSLLTIDKYDACSFTYSIAKKSMMKYQLQISKLHILSEINHKHIS
jgi:hypothetical protein